MLFEDISNGGNKMLTKKVKVIIISILLGLICTWFSWLGATLLPATVNYKVTETYQFNTQTETDISLMVLLPKDGPYQSVSRQVIDWPGSIEERESNSMEVLTFLGTVQPGVHEVSITYTAQLRQGLAKWDAEIDPITLQPQPRIESDHPEIIEAAFKLGEGTSREDAYDIFKYASQYILSYPEDMMNRRPTALTALQTKEGVCDDYAHLMVGLLRARGIPSRVVWGLSFGNLLSLPYGPAQAQAWNHVGGSHAWVEVFTGDKWEMAEPTWAGGSFVPWLYFGRSLGSHLSYGDAEEHDIIYQEIFEEAKQGGKIIGAMSAPLKFVAATNTDDVVFTPMCTVKKGWDGRWLNGILIFLLALVPSRFLIRHIEKK